MRVALKSELPAVPLTVTVAILVASLPVPSCALTWVVCARSR